MTTITEAAPEAKVVAGSDGLLLEIDGQIVPNYDATFTLFEEGEVVTGIVVRIDNDEVLVDIGYKSEGVIPSNELSIRKAVDPRVAALLVIRTGQAAATEVFVRGVADPPPLQILEGLTDMICRYLLEDLP